MVLVSGSLKHFVVQQRGVGTQRKDLMCAVTAVVQEEPPRETQSAVQAAERQAPWHYNYYGVHGNFASLKQFFDGAMHILFEWLNRHSQRRSCNWTGFKEMLDRFKVEQPRIVGRPRACPEPFGYAQGRLV